MKNKRDDVAQERPVRIFLPEKEEGDEATCRNSSHPGDGSRQSRLPVINVSDGANVQMRLRAAVDVVCAVLA